MGRASITTDCVNSSRFYGDTSFVKIEKEREDKTKKEILEKKFKSEIKS